MSRYLFKQTKFEQAIAEATSSLQTSASIVNQWVATQKSSSDSIYLPPTEESVLAPVVEKLFTPFLRVCNYELSSHNTHTPRDEDGEDLDEVHEVKTDVMISTFHTWTDHGMKNNQIIPLFKLLDEFLPTLRYFDNVALESSAEKKIALTLAQHVWTAVRLVLWIHLPENKDVDFVKECLDEFDVYFLTEEDVYEGDSPPSLMEMFKLLKVDFTHGFDYFQFEIFRYNILFPLDNIDDKTFQIHRIDNLRAPRQTFSRNLFTLLFDYQLLAPYTTPKEMSKQDNTLFDMLPAQANDYALQSYLKNLVTFFVSHAKDSIVMVYFIHVCGLFSQLHTHFTNVVQRYNIKEEVLGYDFSSPAAQQAKDNALTEYKTGLEQWTAPIVKESGADDENSDNDEDISDSDEDSSDSDEDGHSPTPLGYSINLAAEADYNHLSQILFCLHFLVVFSSRFRSELTNYDFNENRILRKMPRSCPNIYPNIVHTLPTFNPESIALTIDWSAIRNWSSHDDDVELALTLYPEQTNYYFDFFVYQTVLYSKLSFVLYKFLNLTVGQNDFYWSAFTGANVVTSISWDQDVTGKNLFDAIDILFASVIRTGGFTANRVLFNLLFDEESYCPFTVSLPKSDDELATELVKNNRIMPGMLPFGDEIDLFVGTPAHQLADQDVLNKATILEKQKALIQDSPTFTHSFIDLILQQHLEDSEPGKLFVPKEMSLWDRDVLDDTRARPLQFKIPALMSFITGILFGYIAPQYFTHEKRYQALIRHLLLEQRLGLIWEQNMLTFVDPHNTMDLKDECETSGRPNYINLDRGVGKYIGRGSAIARITRGLEERSCESCADTLPSAYNTISLSGATEPMLPSELPISIPGLSAQVKEWKIATTHRQNEFKNGLVAQEKELLPIFPFKFTDSYQFLYKEQLSMAYKAWYKTQMSIYHQTNMWPIYIFLLQQQYCASNIYLIKERFVRQMFGNAKLTGIVPFPTNKENLGNALWFNEDAILPHSKEDEDELDLGGELFGSDTESETESENAAEAKSDGDEAKQSSKYVYKNLPVTQLYNWIYILGQLRRYDDIEHNQSDLIFIDGLKSTQANSFSYESPLMLEQMDQILFGRQFMDEGELESTNVTDVALQALMGVANCNATALAFNVDRGIDLDYDIVKSFLVTIDRFNLLRTVLYRGYQLAELHSWSKQDDLLVQISITLDYAYNRILTRFEPTLKRTDSEFGTYVATVHQRLELLTAILHGSSNSSFARRYGRPDDAYAHYYPLVDSETGEEKLGDGKEEDENDKPWSSWPDLTSLNILDYSLDLFNQDPWDKFSKELNHCYPLLTLVGALKADHSDVCTEWVEERKQQVDNQFLIDKELLPKKTDGTEYDVDTLVPLVINTNAFMTQFAIETFIGMLLEGNENEALAGVLGDINFTNKINPNQPFVQVTSANAQQILGNPLPTEGKILVQTNPVHFGFYDNGANPFKTAAFQYKSLEMLSTTNTTGFIQFDSNAQAIKLKNLAQSVSKLFENKF